MLAFAAEKFGCRPSRMVGLCDPVLALDFDLAAAAKLLQAERAAARALMEDPSQASASGQRGRNVCW